MAKTAYWARRVECVNLSVLPNLLNVFVEALVESVLFVPFRHDTFDVIALLVFGVSDAENAVD
jgi:hypothetical protein